MKVAAGVEALLQAHFGHRADATGVQDQPETARQDKSGAVQGDWDSERSCAVAVHRSYLKKDEALVSHAERTFDARKSAAAHMTRGSCSRKEYFR